MTSKIAQNIKAVAKNISNFSKKEIDELFATGKAILKNKELVFITAPCFLPYGRVLLITSRKVGNAPQRNRLRRQSRAIFYEQRLFTLGYNAIIIFKAPATHLEFAQLQTMILQAFHKHVASQTAPLPA